MLKNKHLDNNLIIEYLNNSKLTIAEIKFIEKHLFNDKCEICLEKYSKLKNFNNLLNSDSIFKNDNSKEEICEQSDKIDNFLEGSLTDHENMEFKKHLLRCDDCRNILSILVKNNTEVYNNTSKKSSEPLWINKTKDNYQLKDCLKNFLNGITGNTIFSNPKIAFRGIEDNKKEYQEIDLPEGNGKVSLTLSSNKDAFNLEIKILNPLNQSRIDIFTNSTMLNSIDGNYISFQIPDEEFRILINDKYEIC
jgi:hypothetical protein